MILGRGSVMKCVQKRQQAEPKMRLIQNNMLKTIFNIQSSWAKTSKAENIKLNQADKHLNERLKNSYLTGTHAIFVKIKPMMPSKYTTQKLRSTIARNENVHISTF